MFSFSRGCRWAIGIVALLSAIGFVGAAQVLGYATWIDIMIGICLLMAFVSFAPSVSTLANRTLAGISSLFLLAMPIYAIVGLISGTGHVHVNIEFSVFVIFIGLAAGYYAIHGRVPDWAQSDDVDDHKGT